MATIQKRGDSYSIRVSCGYNIKGKQVIQSMTWKPDAKMISKQIEKELNRQDAEALRLGDRWVETDRLYTKWDGRPMQNSTPYFWLGEFCEKNDLPFYGLHSFRHLFASCLVNAGVDIVTVSGALGHLTVSTTSNIYCHMLQEAQAKVSDAISNALDFSKNKEREIS